MVGSQPLSQAQELEQPQPQQPLLLWETGSHPAPPPNPTALLRERMQNTQNARPGVPEVQIREIKTVFAALFQLNVGRCYPVWVKLIIRSQSTPISHKSIISRT